MSFIKFINLFVPYFNYLFDFITDYFFFLINFIKFHYLTLFIKFHNF